MKEIERYLNFKRLKSTALLHSFFAFSNKKGIEKIERFGQKYGMESKGKETKS